MSRRRAESLLLESKILGDLVFLDPLTRLVNRRGYNRYLDVLRDDDGAWISMVAIDVDRFKEVNDTFGHGAGDAVLVAIAGLLKRSVRESDLAARLGGDEFVIILRQTLQAEAKERAQQIADSVAHHDWSTIDPDLHVSISVGVAAGPSENLEDLADQADKAMYSSRTDQASRATS